LRFHINGFYEDKLSKEYVEREIRKKLSIPELEERSWMEIMVEVPSTVLLIDKFIEAGIDGVSFGTNDLTMLILGIDRDDAAVQEICDERNLAVLRALSHVIRICRKHGVTTSICGQAPSNYPEIVEFLIKEGPQASPSNPDKVVETRSLVATIERKIMLEELRSLREKMEGNERRGPLKWSRELD